MAAVNKNVLNPRVSLFGVGMLVLNSFLMLKDLHHFLVIM